MADQIHRDLPESELHEPKGYSSSSTNEVPVNDGTTTTWKLVSAANLATGAVTTVKINDLSVTSAKLASSSVSRAKIGSFSVSLDKLGSTSIDYSWIISAGDVHTFMPIDTDVGFPWRLVVFDSGEAVSATLSDHTGTSTLSPRFVMLSIPESLGSTITGQVRVEFLEIS